MQKIDVFTHILPTNYLKALSAKTDGRAAEALNAKRRLNETQPNTIAVPGWAPVRLEGCKAYGRTAREMKPVHREDNMVGTFETGRS